MVKLSAAILFSAAFSIATSANAWWDGGHMQVAVVAYKQLTPAVRDRVDVLLRLNPDYGKWTSNAPDAATAKKWAFVHAATWADDIKTRPHGYTRDAVTDPTAGQNIGYADKNQHDYWHYKDLGFSPDGTPVPSQNPVDAVTQLKLMMTALPSSSSATDDIRSYDLVWMLHLIGDVHQPLHAVARYTHELPGGDRGGNSEMVMPSTGEVVNLHAYWDGMFGGYVSSFGAIFDAEGQGGLGSVDANPDLAKDLDPEHWVQESAELAKTYAYAPPVSRGADPVSLSRDYETKARNIARAQAALAGARLANVINDALK